MMRALARGGRCATVQTVLLLAATLTAPAAAQDAAPADTVPVQTLPEPTPAASAEAAPPTSATALETVVVTAQKREASLQNTPISLLAFDRRKLETLDIRGVADLMSNVPAMTVDPFPTNTAQLRLFIRGIGLIDAQVTQDAAVGVYVDGVYIARSAGLALEYDDDQRPQTRKRARAGTAKHGTTDAAGAVGA